MADIIICVIVAIAMIFAVRSVIKKKGGCCDGGCDGCCKCSSNKK